MVKQHHIFGFIQLKPFLKKYLKTYETTINKKYISKDLKCVFKTRFFVYHGNSYLLLTPSHLYEQINSNSTEQNFISFQNLPNEVQKLNKCAFI